MQSDWPQIRLGDYVDSCLGKMLDKEKNRGTLFPYLGNKNVRWGSFDIDDLAQMRFEEHEHERYGLKYGDLVVCEGGEPGRCAIWKEQMPEMKIQKALHRIRPYDGLNNIYLHYWFLLAGKAGLLEPFFTGTTIKHLTGRALANLQVPLPPVKTQESIAHILGSLDDKIELNRQMNTTLEAMAQALFKSWFVDFDPVLDKALAAGNPIPDVLKEKAAARQALGDARKPLPEEVAALFPAAFVWTEEMGWIPEGWEVANFGKLAKLNPESWTAKNKPESVFYVDLSNTKDGRITSITHYPFSEAPSRARRVLKINDTIIGTVRPGNRSFAYIQKPELTGSTGFAVMRPQKECYRTFIYFGLTQDSIIDNFAHLADGAAYPAIRPEVVVNTDVVLPTEDILLNCFDDSAYPWLRKIGENEVMSESLASLRDVLLPKLLSGELRIPDAESLIKEAVL